MACLFFFFSFIVSILTPTLDALDSPLPTQQTSKSQPKFFPTMNLTTTTSDPLQAHGGCILMQNETYYWFGEDKTSETTSGHFIAINLYSSPDLATWTYIGPVLSPIAGTKIDNSSVVERPKVLFNNGTGEWVMWFHSDDAGYDLAEVGVAVSGDIGGQYEWLGSWGPFGGESRDMTVWKDEDGTGYLIYATNGNADLQIANLTADYHNVSDVVYTWEDVYWEAPGVLKVDGVYYLIYSKQDGWTPTDNYYMTATSMAGPWSDPVLLAPEGYYAYNTQNAYELTIPGTSQPLYIYYGDHWNAPNLGASSYSFLPLILNTTTTTTSTTTSTGNSSNNTTLSLHNTGGWTADIETGAWQDLPYTLFTPSSPNITISPASAIINCDTCATGATVEMTSTTVISFAWSGSGGRKVLGVRYVYDGGKQAWKQVSVTIGGRDIGGVVLMESTRGTEVYFEAPVAVELEAGDVVELRLVQDTGTTVLAEGVRVYEG